MRPESRKAAGWCAALVILVIVGSRNLSHFDAALVAYTFASLFAVAGITYRYAIWLARVRVAARATRFVSDHGFRFSNDLFWQRHVHWLFSFFTGWSGHRSSSLRG
jgi:hypothetical protein